MNPDRTLSHVDPGAQSGNETQYVFSETDVRHSDSDLLTIRPVGGWIIIPRSIRLLWMTLFTNMLFLCLCLHSLVFLDASKLKCVLVSGLVSSPSGGVPASLLPVATAVESSVPGGALPGGALPRSPSSDAEGLNVPLSTLLPTIFSTCASGAPVVVSTASMSSVIPAVTSSHGGEILCPPDDERIGASGVTVAEASGGAHTAFSPRFTTFLHECGLTVGSRTASPVVKQGRLFMIIL